MAGARCEVDGLAVIPGRAKREPRCAIAHRRMLRDSGFACFARPGMTPRRYFPAPPLLSKNTPCSPNMFQTHQGRFSGTGRP